MYSAAAVKRDNQICNAQPNFARIAHFCAAPNRMGCHDKQEYNLIAIFPQRNACDIVN